jgi:IS5 family transposase
MWEELLPAECRGLPAELEAVDRLLDDERFFEPYRRHFDPEVGRPSIPIETYVRMMWLKFRYRLGFETLCREVADSLSWRRFCRIGLGERVPHPTTLMKITKRCGPATVDALNETLLAKAAEAKVVKLDKVRADTTVVEANVAYPTDSGLLARGVAKMARLTRRLRGFGLARRTRFRDRTRSMRRRAHSIGAWLRRRTESAKDEVYAITGEMVDRAEAAVVDARAVVGNARRALRGMGSRASGGAVAAVAELERVAELVERIAAQTRTRLAGETPPGATRVVSLHDPDARPIVKGRLGKPVEYGYLAQVLDNTDGIVLDHGVHVGNPPDAPLLLPAIGRVIQRFRRAHERSPPTGATARPPWRPTCAPPASSSWPSPARAGPVPPARPSNAARGSGGSSSGAPVPKAGSPISSTATAGRGRCSTASTAPISGAGSASWPTTRSRSPISSTNATGDQPGPSTHNRQTRSLPDHPEPGHPPPTSPPDPPSRLCPSQTAKPLRTKGQTTNRGHAEPDRPAVTSGLTGTPRSRQVLLQVEVVNRPRSLGASGSRVGLPG